METDKIIHGSSLEVLKTLPDESVDMVMTSPPYWALRDYGVEGQLGLEPTIEEYISNLCAVFDEVKRVLKKEGTCWVNLADTYYGGGRNRGGDFANMSAKQRSNRGTREVDATTSFQWGSELSSKSMCLIPERFVIEMVNRGWILRNKICWYKRNSMPSSVKDRFCNKWEYVFLFSKSKKYYFNLDAVRKPQLPSSVNRINAGFSKATSFNYRVREAVKGTLQKKFGEKYSATEKEKAKYKNMSLEQAEALGEPRAREVRYNSKFPDKHHSNMADRMASSRATGHEHDSALTHPLGGNPGDHWDITNQPHPFAHFACYPERLCEVPIKAGCPEGGIVLDPFSGSGTTALVALKQGKKFLGIELNPEYIKIAEERLKPYREQRKLA